MASAPAALRCFLPLDLSSVRLLTGEGEEQRWSVNATSAPRPAEAGAETPGDEPRDALWWRKQVGLLADWLALRASPGRVLDTLCLDVAPASCVFVQAPSADRRVIAAALRQSGGEWASANGGLIEPLTDGAHAGGGSRLMEFRAFGIGAKKRPESDSAVRTPVLLAPDAMPRLLLDDLDKRGVRVRRVTTLWHEAARIAGAGAAPGALCAVVLLESDRAVWAWSREGLLVTGGALAVPPVAPPVVEGEPAPPPAPREHAHEPDLRAARSRLALDWLSWAAQIGDAPRAVRVVGVNAGRFATEIAGTWAESAVSAEESADPVRAALASAARSERAEAPDDARLELVSLTRRPGGAHRRLYTWTGAALALLAVALGALGWRQRDLRAGLLEGAATLRARQAERLAEAAPDLRGNASPVRALEARLLEIKGARPEFADPPRARPVLEEAERLLTAAADMAERGLIFEEAQVHDMIPSARVIAPDFIVGEAFAQRLRALGPIIRWRVEYEGGGDENRRYRLLGDWPREGT